jgi:protein-S-isoprenylcysteine O-methyltransferase Ste14
MGIEIVKGTMISDSTSHHNEKNPASRPAIGVKALLRFAFYLILTPLPLFLAAGRINWGMAWVFLGLSITFTLFSRLMAYRKNPAVLTERAQSLEAENAKAWDKWLVLIVALIGPISIFIVAGLNLRFSWLPQVALPWQITGLILVVLGYTLGSWAFIANAYFSAVVRIQAERDHTVIREGPYRYLRHPAYASSIVTFLAFPLMLGSFWALIPAVLTILAVILRTSLEDRTLQEELSGYCQYTRETPYRLVPGLW